tara:strand:- start:842 stop:1081 length:240 start_codon:yes stop_codon:yes gene_type:complete
MKPKRPINYIAISTITMDYYSLILGIVIISIGIAINPWAKKGIQEDDSNYFEVKVYILCFVIIILGFIIIAKELAKIDL